MSESEEDPSPTNDPQTTAWLQYLQQTPALQGLGNPSTGNPLLPAGATLMPPPTQTFTPQRANVPRLPPVPATPSCEVGRPALLPKRSKQSHKVTAAELKSYEDSINQVVNDSSANGNLIQAAAAAAGISTVEQSLL